MSNVKIVLRLSILGTICLLLAGSQALAQQKAKFKELAPGLEVLRLWEVVEEPRWPEHAIFRMSMAIHDEFHKDPSAFVNKHKIFSKPVQPGAICLRLREDIEPKGGCRAEATHFINSGLS